MREDPKFDAWVRKMAPQLNEPPKVVPRLEMWQEIEAARQTALDAQAGRIPGVTPIRRHWRLMSVIAAALLVGVAIDRVVVRRADRQRTLRSAVSVPATSSDSSDPSRLYRMAATQTLTQAEALLTAYRASTGENSDARRQLGRWGRDILSSTRLLIDSPAGSDPRLRVLLSDLELVLVQIIQLSGAPLDPNDRALIDRALEERDLITRIRTTVPAGVVDAANE